MAPCVITDGATCYLSAAHWKALTRGLPYGDWHLRNPSTIPATSSWTLRDPLFTESFTAVLKSGGVECVKIPERSPNCNPHAERFVKTIKYVSDARTPSGSVSLGRARLGAWQMQRRGANESANGERVG